MTPSIDYAAAAPEIIVSAGLCLVLVVDLVLRGQARVMAGWLSLSTLAAAAVALGTFAASGAAPVETLGGLFVQDGFSVVFKALMLGSAAVVVLLSLPPLRGHRYEGEYYFLLLSSVLGTMLMASSRELLMLFISLELVSAPAFIIAGLRKRNPRSNEAALKFFLIGVLSAAILVYGISLVYGFTGTTRLADIADIARDPEPLLMTAIVFIIAAFGFKISAVPFHFWAPDTYEGSPTPLAAFLSVSSKAAGFVGLLLILMRGFPNLSEFWGPIVAVIAIATMTVGNLLALKQRHIVRLRSYSSIAQAGYMLIPLALIRPFTSDANRAVNAANLRALALYLLIYAVMNLGAFAVVIGLSRQHPALLLRDLAGLGRRAPFHAASLAIFVLSLGGIPPFAGLWAKFFVFLAAVNAGSTMGLVLAAAMVVNSVISLYYYVGIVRTMWLDAPEEAGALRFPRAVSLAGAACLAGVVFIGVYPQLLVKVAQAVELAF
ncbi:MAG TPA: NADH-quinone oxidoreductase subunit N [Actinomycetota bacterium]|nr:NADH-quinone oxidoreductase subunit N [Actinomycetota bacterium]